MNTVKVFNQECTRWCKEQVFTWVCRKVTVNPRSLCTKYSVSIPVSSAACEATSARNAALNDLVSWRRATAPPHRTAPRRLRPPAVGAPYLMNAFEAWAALNHCSNWFQSLWRHFDGRFGRSALSIKVYLILQEFLVVVWVWVTPTITLIILKVI